MIASFKSTRQNWQKTGRTNSCRPASRRQLGPAKSRALKLASKLARRQKLAAKLAAKLA
jgi:hypothetical protein